MAYIYWTTFEMKPGHQTDLAVGESVEEALSYLRTLLPNQPGYVSSRAAYSVGLPGDVLVAMESVWETWDDLVAHQESALAENKLIREFQPHIEAAGLITRIFREVE